MNIQKLIQQVDQHGYGSYNLTGGPTRISGSRISSEHKYDLPVDQAIKQHVSDTGFWLDHPSRFMIVIKNGSEVIILNREYE